MIDVKTLKPGFYSQVGVAPELIALNQDIKMPIIIGTAPIYRYEIKTSTLNFSLSNYGSINSLDKLIYKIDSIVASDATGSIGYGNGYTGTTYSNGYYVGKLGDNVIGSVTNSFNIVIKYKENLDDNWNVINYNVMSTDSISNIITGFNNLYGNEHFRLELVGPVSEQKLLLIALKNYIFKIEINDAIKNVLGFNTKYPNCILYKADSTGGKDYIINGYFIRSDYSVKGFYTIDSIYSEYGQKYDPIYSTIPIAAMLFFENGYDRLLVKQLQIEEEADNIDIVAAYKTALNELEYYNISAIIPTLPINKYDIISSTIGHVFKMSSMAYRKERICIFGVDETNGYISNIDQYIDALKVEKDVRKRIQLLYPGIAYTVDAEGNRITIPSSIYSAGYVSKMLTFDVATSMTRKSINGITMPYPEKFSEPEKNQLTLKGITYIDSQSGGAVVRRSITLDDTDYASQEISITNSIDYVVNSLRKSLESMYVGTKILGPSTYNNIASSTNKMLDDFVALQIISDFKDISVVQGESPNIVNISFKVRPIYTLLWGVINLTITL
jgi:hypothetical protein